MYLLPVLNVQVCKQYPGFLRVALQDPQPERRFFRRGWVTYSNEANVKEICYNLNLIRVCMLTTIIYVDYHMKNNRELMLNFHLGYIKNFTCILIMCGMVMHNLYLRRGQ